MSRNPMPEGRRDEVLRRDNYTCQASAYGWPTTRRCDPHLEVQHRRGRGMGGTSDPTVHDLDMLVTLCRTHHAEVESRRTDAYECGLAVKRNAVTS